MTDFKQAFSQIIIYVYRIPDEAHEGVLKIGETSCALDTFQEPNSKVINEIARVRIRKQTQTAGVQFELLHTEIASYTREDVVSVFRDHDIHGILERSGIKHEYFDKKNKANEWFYTDLGTVKKAILAAKEGRSSLSASEVTQDLNPVQLRPEQREAVERTIKQFNKKISNRKMLWNAKMRFGKTLSALQVIKECDYRRTLILTHRPVVDDGWFEDYKKIFYDRPEYSYGSKNNGLSIDEAEETTRNTLTGSYIYFASIQDMRGSEAIGGKYDKNTRIFEIDWDLIVIDEAHEGTQTDLGKRVLEQCAKKNTRELHLSGTPFNLMRSFEEEEIYTWDYVMEQRAKANWDTLHPGDPNPYACLPAMNIFTYSVGELFKDFYDADIAFNFKEFLRVDEHDCFIHKGDVLRFLDLLVSDETDSHYPFSTQSYRDNFRHSLWMIPGVKEARALSALLKNHDVFGCFDIVNVAGAGDEEVDSSDALLAVKKAMTEHPERTYTITLSCGRLTTGVSVQPWTACLMLAGSYNTTASAYMQTIFRVQTPAIIDGKQKEECFVFDFAPDRTLKVIAEAVKISSKAGKTSGEDRVILSEFLNFCPIIGYQGSEMIVYDTPKMLEQLKNAYIERVVHNGFEDTYLYNDDLLKLSEIEMDEFIKLKGIIGNKQALDASGDITVNAQGYKDERFEKAMPDKNQQDDTLLTPEKKIEIEKLKEQRKNRDIAVSILRSISIRMPLLIYGANLEEASLHDNGLSLDDFIGIVDDKSWEEFMPRGVTKEKFRDFKKYYDPEIFRAAGKKIREMARAADGLSIEERVGRISAIFNMFRNPDKETVLTPWRVVNMHMTDTLGGWCFYDSDYCNPIEDPIYVEHDDITRTVYTKESKILDINSKSGLYALYCAYTIFRLREKKELAPDHTQKDANELWKKVLEENIYVICKTPMAKSITIRTLAGYSDTKMNAHYFDDLINQLSSKQSYFIEKVTKPSYWNKEGAEMRFDAIVGNPPYHLETNVVSKQATPLYNLFVDIAKKLNPKCITLIMPSRWFSGGIGLDSFRKEMMNDNRISHIFDYVNAKDCFPNISLSGGICYFLWNKEYDGKCQFTNIKNGKRKTESRKLNEFEILVRYNDAIAIIHKISGKKEGSLSDIVSSISPFRLSTKIRGRKNFENQDDVTVYSSEGNGYISKSEISDDILLLDKYKLMISQTSAEHAGEPSRDGSYRIFTSSIRVLKPNEVCTHSYIVIGNFNTQNECSCLLSYVKTKFVRFLVLLCLSSIHISKASFIFVPLQCFTQESDIDWTVSIAEIDVTVNFFASSRQLRE